MNKPFLRPCVVTLITSLLCGGCGTTISARHDAAQSIASGAQLTRQDLSTPDFVLGSWRKITAPGAPINVYIEGDGLAWLSRSEPSLNPTPKNPLALHLASIDPAPNVIYIARPCQYVSSDMAGNTSCRDSSYWRGKRFAPEIIRSYQAALDAIAAEHSGGFNLIGYSGGANIAGLIAQDRADVLSLRTVAGNIDNDYFVKFHGVSEMPYSLNMADNAASLNGLPQLHFIGAEDTTVPIDIYKSYAGHAPASSCVHYKLMDGVSHEDGWMEQWRDLLSLPVDCH